MQVSQTTGSGFKLYKRPNGIWSMKTPKGFYYGSLDQIKNVAALDFNIETKEINIAVKEMEANFYNAAQFGVLGSFMWAYDVEGTNENFNTMH